MQKTKRRETEDKFTMVPNTLKKEIPAHLILIYSYLLRLAATKKHKQKQDNSIITVKEISNRLKISKNTTSKYFQELEDLELINRENNTFTVNCITPFSYYKDGEWQSDDPDYNGPFDTYCCVKDLSITFKGGRYIELMKNKKNIKFVNGFDIVPDSILLSKEMSYSDKCAWYYFKACENMKSKMICSIANAFGIKSKETIKKMLDNLLSTETKKGYITNFTSNGKGIYYEMSEELVNSKSNRNYNKKETKMIVNENSSAEEILEAMSKGEPLETTIEEPVVETKESIMDILTEANEEDWGIALGNEPTESPSANAPVCEEEITFKANEKINHSDDELQTLADSLDNGSFYKDPFEKETKTIEEPKQKEVVNTSKIPSVKLNSYMNQIRLLKVSNNVEGIKKLLSDAEWDYGREGRAELERILKENRNAKFVKEAKAMEVKETKSNFNGHFKFDLSTLQCEEELPSLEELAAMC